MAAPSPARERLAQRIGTYDEVRTELERLRKAADPAMRDDWAAEAAIEKAEKVLADVEQAAVQHRVMILAGDATEAPPDIAKARAAIQTARDHAATASAVRKQVDDRLRALEDDLPNRESLVREAAQGVLQAEAAAQAKALAKQLAPLQQQLADLGAALAYLVDNVRAEGLDDATKAIARRHHEMPAAWRLPSNALQRWREAVTALQTDANAALPKS